MLSGSTRQQALELLLERLKKTQSNIEFLTQVQKTATVDGDPDDVPSGEKHRADCVAELLHTSGSRLHWRFRFTSPQSSGGDPATRPRGTP